METDVWPWTDQLGSSRIRLLVGPMQAHLWWPSIGSMSIRHTLSSPMIGRGVLWKLGRNEGKWRVSVTLPGMDRVGRRGQGKRRVRIGLCDIIFRDTEQQHFTWEKLENNSWGHLSSLWHAEQDLSGEQAGFYPWALVTMVSIETDAPMAGSDGGHLRKWRSRPRWYLFKSSFIWKGQSTINSIKTDLQRILER